MDSELEEIGQLAVVEQVCLALCMTSVGALLSGVCSIATLPAGPMPVLLVIVITASSVLALFAGAFWFGARRRRPALIKRIRARGAHLRGLPQAH